MTSPPAHQGTAGALLTTSQYLSGALTLAILTIALGTSPGNAAFRTSFLIITAAAVAGAVLVASTSRRLRTSQSPVPAPQPSPSRT